MNWKLLRAVPWLDIRAGFVAQTPRGGTLLDLGSSDGETLQHMAELRPDLKLFSADKEGQPGNYPAGCEFRQADFETDALPWEEATMDAITCMHVVEHLQQLTRLFQEVRRLLKPGGRVYFETPHPKTLKLPSQRGQFTMNFFDDPTHVRVVTPAELVAATEAVGLRVRRTGISRNWLFAAAWPWYRWQRDSRQKFTARVHWLGWSAYLVAQRSA